MTAVISVNLYCDGDACANAAPFKDPLGYKFDLANDVREAARKAGWYRTRGLDLCPRCGGAKR